MIITRIMVPMISTIMITDLLGQTPKSGSRLAGLENGAENGESTKSGRQQVDYQNDYFGRFFITNNDH